MSAVPVRDSHWEERSAQKSLLQQTKTIVDLRNGYTVFTELSIRLEPEIKLVHGPQAPGCSSRARRTHRTNLHVLSRRRDTLQRLATQPVDPPEGLSCFC